MTTQPQDVFAIEDMKRQKQERDFQNNLRLSTDINSVMNTEQGRRTMAGVLSVTGYTKSLSVSNALLMANLSGRRDVGLEVLRKLQQVCPELVTKMNEEANG